LFMGDVGWASRAHLLMGRAISLFNLEQPTNVVFHLFSKLNNL
jgi:hypothetical protein